MLRMLLVLFAYAAGTVVSLGSAVYASCFFIWSDIFRPADWARRIGFLSSPAFLPVHLCTAVLGLSILLRRWNRRWNMGATVILVSLVWFFVCALAAEYRDLAIDRTLTAAKYFIPLAFISATLCTRGAQRLFLYTLAGSVGIWMTHHGLLGLVRMSPIIDMSIPGGQMSDRNDFLVAGTACVPLMLFAAFHYKGRWQSWVRPALKVASLLAALSAVFSLSRGAIVGFAALLVWYSFLTGRFFRRIAVGAVIAGIALWLMPNFVWTRMETIQPGEYQTEGSARNRVEHMLTAVKVTLDYPLTGVGADNFPIVSLRYSVFDAEPHSLWLKCSSEYGFPMLVFFLLLVILLLVRLRRRAGLLRSVGDKEGEAMATALSCALFGFLATGTFTSQFLSEYLWAIIGLIGAFLATPVETGKVLPPTSDPEPVAVGLRAA
jgi:O-antigen ligase